MNNTSLNFNTPYFNKDSKLTSTLDKSKHMNIKDEILIREEMKSNMNSTQKDFKHFQQETIGESSNFDDFQDRDDVSNSN